MDRVQHSFDNISLIEAVTRGDGEGVRKAIQAGADVNASHSDGRTAIACAITGEDWQNIDASFMSNGRLDSLKALLVHQNVSLFALNAPQDAMKGVTPLGMAAWLNSPDAVQLLLESSDGAVSVDGMDAHGATALMYAARDGSLRVIQTLLAHGARPDFRDIHHRTSVQFALTHPQALWACEDALRRQRWNESQSGNKRNLSSSGHSTTTQILTSLTASLALSESFQPPSHPFFSAHEILKSTNTLVHAVLSSDLSIISSLLFPPPSSTVCPTKPSPTRSPRLVNAPDTEGWSAIHYCVTARRPSIEVLDALYRAGADVSLFTTFEQYTPLHCLARAARLCDDQLDPALSLYLFAVHLIRDLRAPLSARNKDDETCIHIAAEHGECLDVLTAFLACDTTGSVREMRNSRGLTALEVAKPDFRHAFGPDSRPLSAASVRTVRPMTSFASLSSFADWHQETVLEQTSTPNCPPANFNVLASSNQLLENLRLTSPDIYHARTSATLNRLDHILLESTEIGNNVLAYFRAKTDEASKELRDVRATFIKVDERLDIVAQAVRDQLQNLGYDSASLTRRRNRDSEDSETTAVSSEVGEAEPSDSKTAGNLVSSIEYRDVAVSTDPPLFRVFQSKGQTSGARTAPWPEWLDGFVLRADSATYKAHLANLVEIEREFSDHEDPNEGVWFPEGKPDAPTGKKRKGGSRGREVADVKKMLKYHHERTEKKSGTAKLMSWLWKKITPERPIALDLVYDVDEENCAVGREAKGVALGPSIVVDPPTEEPATGLRHGDSSGSQSGRSESSATRALRSSNLVLTKAGRDLTSIEECMTVANRLISTAIHSISRVDRIIQHALETRKVTVDHLRLSVALTMHDDGSDDDLFTSAPSSPGSLSPTSAFSRSRKPSPLNSSIYLLSAHSSAQSSNVSLASTLAQGDDEDTAALARLLLHKIQVRLDGAFDEINKTVVWLRIVKEVVRDVTKRACL